MKALKLFKRIKKSLNGKDVKLPSPEKTAELITDFVWLHGSEQDVLRFKKEFFLDRPSTPLTSKNEKKIIKSCILQEEKYSLGCFFLDFKDLAKVITSVSFRLLDRYGRERFYNAMKKQF